jgi:hypothetical protein
MAVPHPVAPAARRGDVARIPATFAPRNKVLSGCLKPARLADGQAIPHGKLARVIEPHRNITIEAATVLF